MFKYVINNTIKDIKGLMKETKTENVYHAGALLWLSLDVFMILPICFFLKFRNVIQINPILAFLLVHLIMIIAVIICEFINYFKNFNYESEYDYYRELPRDYSPSMVSYLMNFKLEYKKDIMADLLFLEQQGVLRIDNNHIIDLNKNIKFKDEHLNYLINNIICDNMDVVDLSKIEKTKIDEYKKSVENDLLLRGLSKKYVPNGIFTGFLAFSCFATLLIGVFNIQNDSKLLPILFAYSAFSFVLLLAYSSNQSIVRSKQGKQDVKLWFSYSKFIKDFSIMEGRSLEEKSLWGYYFAYGLALGINQKVIKKFKLEKEVGIVK